MKKALAALLCLTLLFVCTCPAFAQDAGTVCSTAAELLDFVIVSRQYTTPLRIVPATLTQNGESRSVYLVAMLGMKEKEGQVNSQKGGGTGPYAALVKETLFQTVPAGSALVFAGHSLGGMTAQILRCDKQLQDTYEILNVLCGGSPLMEVEADGEGSLHRLTDIWDLIPYIRSTSLCAFIRQIKTAHRESGCYFLNPDGAHNDSYGRNDVWGSYDVFGEKGGTAELQFYPEQICAYGAAAG
ncbi:MAG: hypothetical protein IJL00_00625 [Clostridia bacterium]|nr:hypothetical protein [Clostridia bacterium]